MPSYTRIGLLLALFTLFCLPVQATETALKLTMDDGFVLDGLLATPGAKKAATPSRLVIFLHGSGPQSMDEDLTAVTRDNQPNLFFKELQDVLLSKGFSVLRFNKRSYQTQLAFKENEAFVKSPIYQKFSADPLLRFIEDGANVVDFAAKRYPKAKIYLLGHSQGASIACWLAEQDKRIAGLALIGFLATPTELAVFEQTVYRPLFYFKQLDKDRNQILSNAELSIENPIAAALKAQMPILDQDADAELTLMEFKAGNFSNLVVKDMLGPAMRQQEAKRSRVTDILKDFDKPVLMFQGEWDNQTPTYQAMAVQIANAMVWKKDNLRLFIYPKLGHALDLRDSYEDIRYNPIDSKAKTDLAVQINKYFQ